MAQTASTDLESLSYYRPVGCLINGGYCLCVFVLFFFIYIAYLSVLVHTPSRFPIKCK